VPSRFEIIVDQFISPRVQREIARLLAFAGDPEMLDAAPRVPEIPNL
jgi:hypothetical protein